LKGLRWFFPRRRTLANAAAPPAATSPATAGIQEMTMEDTASGAPLHTIEVELAELAKCTPAELHIYFGDVYHAEEADYIARQGAPKIAWAAIDLDKYASMEDFVAQCRKVHKGNAVRDALRAEKLGYYSKFFDFPSYNPDVVAINTSSPTRQGRPMTPHMRRSVEEAGGYPTRIAPPRIPGQAAAWVQGFGLFRKREGHRQGDVVSDEQLLAYISYRRVGNFTYYGAIIGHADHLGEGVMYKMHLDLICAVLQARTAAAGAEPERDCLKGIRYVGYADFYNIRDGLLMWKKRGLFEPIFFQCDYLAPCWVDRLCAAAEFAPEHITWQQQCARMLADAAERCRAEGREAEAAQARMAFAEVAKRLPPEESTAA
jgi:hypothetical protein